MTGQEVDIQWISWLARPVEYQWHHHGDSHHTESRYRQLIRAVGRNIEQSENRQDHGPIRNANNFNVLGSGCCIELCTTLRSYTTVLGGAYAPWRWLSHWLDTTYPDARLNVLAIRIASDSLTAARQPHPTLQWGGYAAPIDLLFIKTAGPIILEIIFHKWQP